MNIGVIGLGYWGNKVLREYIDLMAEGKIDGVGICDVRKEITKKNLTISLMPP